MKKIQLEEVLNKELRAMINDIRRFLKQEEKEMEINQMVIGMKYLFRGFVIKKWSGTDFSFSMKYIELNKVVIVHYMNFYLKCWEDRNECLHNLEEQ